MPPLIRRATACGALMLALAAVLCTAVVPTAALAGDCHHGQAAQLFVAPQPLYYTVPTAAFTAPAHYYHAPPLAVVERFTGHYGADRFERLQDTGYNVVERLATAPYAITARLVDNGYRQVERFREVERQGLLQRILGGNKHAQRQVERFRGDGY